MTIPASQAAAAALCARLTGAPVALETHISAVFVGARRVLKLKKAVGLGFLDFTTLAARERFCRRELELNAPAAPGVYRAVHAITRGADGALQLGGDGPAVEWVLEMTPLPARDFLDVVAAEGRLDAALQDALGDAVWGLHAALPPLAGIDAPARLGVVIDECLASARAAGLPEAASVAWHAAARARLAALAPELAARAGAGLLRRSHGDLHLGNLVLWQGRPTPFDALEFDEALARIDVGYDLAFLLMDLDLRVGRAAANRVFNRYVARGGDAGLCVALPLWLSLRAMVRAHCEARAARPWQRYLDAAGGYLVPAPARLVAIGGVPGSGKSWLARRLAPGLGAAPGALLLRSDELRKRHQGVPPEVKLPAAAYVSAVSALVHAELCAMAGVALRGGQSVIADAVFLDPAVRAAIGAAAGAAPFTGLWLQAPEAVLRARVAGRAGDASDADLAVLTRALAADPGPLDWHRLDAGGDPEPAARAALGLPRAGTC